MSGIPLFPERASTFAPSTDGLYIFIWAVSFFFLFLIAGLVLYFGVAYRRRHKDETGAPIHGSLLLEIGWTLPPLVIVAIVFFWSADIYFHAARVPKNAIEVNVVGKRWMWKVQHITGRREINELHVPRGVPVKLTLTSEDVIHSFYVPAFRVKKDAVPGRYNTLWFEATKAGRYHLFCAEYCGTKHSGMIGWVTVMEPDEFQNWLAGGVAGQSPAASGEKLFTQLACITCHRADTGARGPNLAGVFGKPVKLANGDVVVADESYVRESIVNPSAKIVAGYQPIMPTFQGMISEEGLLQLIAYIQSLKPEEGAAEAGAPPPPAGQPAQQSQ
jgi:cytochrome c oxidase subunit 2